MRVLRKLQALYNRPRFAPRNVYTVVDPLSRTKHLKLWRGRFISRTHQVINRLLEDMRKHRPRATMALAKKILRRGRMYMREANNLSHYIVTRMRVRKWVGVLDLLKDAIRIRMRT